MTEDLTQGFGTSSEIQAIIASELEKLTSCRNAPVLAEMVEGKLNNALQVGYDTAKEEVKTPSINMGGGVIVYIIQ